MTLPYNGFTKLIDKLLFEAAQATIFHRRGQVSRPAKNATHFWISQRK